MIVHPLARLEEHSMVLQIIIIDGVLCAWLCWYLARLQHRNKVDWFVYGLLFGPFGVLAIARKDKSRTPEYLVKRPCPYCQKPVNRAATVCDYCHCEVFINNAPEPVPADLLRKRYCRDCHREVPAGASVCDFCKCISFVAVEPVEGRLLKKWVSNRRAHYESRWWEEIGEEVIARKTLWLTAAEELKSQDIPNVNVYNLAATDVFVEKAQKAISERAKVYLWIGGVVSVLTLVGLVLVAIFLYDSMREDITKGLEALPFTLRVIKMTTIGALLGGAGYFLVGIANACLQEGTALYSRRHALRFGRLYVYLTGGKVKFEELEAAFNWNEEVHTAFRHLRADKATKSVAQMIADTGIEAIKAGAAVSKPDKLKKSQ
jgi:hypothetical protein